MLKILKICKNSVKCDGPGNSGFVKIDIYLVIISTSPRLERNKRALDTHNDIKQTA